MEKAGGRRERGGPITQALEGLARRGLLKGARPRDQWLLDYRLGDEFDHGQKQDQPHGRKGRT